MANTSRQQDRVRRILERELRGISFEENATPEWLVGLTFRRLQLDFYIKEFSIAIEVQGRQHDQYVEHFHFSPLGYQRLRKRDEEKSSACKNAKVWLIEIRNEQDEMELVQLVRNLVQAKQEKRDKFEGTNRQRYLRAKNRRRQWGRKAYYIHADGKEIPVIRSVFETSVQQCFVNRVDFYSGYLRGEYGVVSHPMRTNPRFHAVQFYRIIDGQKPALTPDETE